MNASPSMCVCVCVASLHDHKAGLLVGLDDVVASDPNPLNSLFVLSNANFNVIS